jgi:hypothetical protein
MASVLAAPGTTAESLGTIYKLVKTG